MQANRVRYVRIPAVPVWAFTGGGPPFAVGQCAGLRTLTLRPMTLQKPHNPQDGLRQWFALIP